MGQITFKATLPDLEPDSATGNPRIYIVKYQRSDLSTSAEWEELAREADAGAGKGKYKGQTDGGHAETEYLVELHIKTVPMKPGDPIKVPGAEEAFDYDSDANSTHEFTEAEVDVPDYMVEG